jgi:hypothetical protein
LSALPGGDLRVGFLCIRPGTEFRLLTSLKAMASATFIAPDGNAIRVTRCPADLFNLPDETEVLAHWHGQWRADGFLLTVGELKRLQPA